MIATVFTLLALAAIGSSLLTVLSRRIFYGALYLLVSMLATAGIFVLLGAEFLAAVQVLVYAGSVMVLFVFVLMTVGFREESRERRGWGWWGTLVVLGSAILGQLVGAVASMPGGDCSGLLQTPAGDVTRAMGDLLFGERLVALEIVSLLILAVMIGIAALRREERR
jgi:NADH:ubiquinone oxidoreductase subunit 6 (subunit J)